MHKIKFPFKGLYCRNGVYYFRKAIPAILRKPGGPSEIVLSLKTRDESLALTRYADAKSSAEEELTAMRDEDYNPARSIDFSKSQQRASAQGRILQDVRSLLSDPVSVRTTVQAIKSIKRVTTAAVKSYLCKNNNEPKINDLPSIYEKSLNYELKDLNTQEYKHKINPLRNACKQLVSHLGVNKNISDLSKDDAKSFYNSLRDRVYNDEITANTANKYLTHLRVLINEYYKEMDLDANCVFSRMNFKEKKSRRSALNISHIRKEWIENNTLSSLNDDLRFIVLAMIDSGCNFKELCGIDPEQDIHLQAEIPHIILRDNKYRKLKTPFRERRIPLVGLALEAFRNCPNGFTRYRDANGPTNASAAINKFLKDNKLFENDDQSAYSIRHCFKDRMREHSIPAEMQDFFMGHKSPGMGPNYGNGYTLKKLQEALEPLAADLK
ncbi:DUF6538 domain-containing protein [Brucella sp. TWI432]